MKIRLAESRVLQFASLNLPRAFSLFLFLAAEIGVSAQMPGQKVSGPPPTQAEQTSQGLRAVAGQETLQVTVCSDAVIHIVATPLPSVPTSPRPWMLDAQQSCPGAPFTFTQDAKAASIKTAQLQVSVNLERGNLSFHAPGGESLLNEGDSVPRTYEPVELNGEHTYRVTDRFSPTMTEAVYGLGSTRTACSTIGAQRWS